MAPAQQPERFHALDATRAFALMLGVVFHAAWSFIGIHLSAPIVDRSGGVLLHWFFFTAHTFRMQLFFLIAGFFARLLVQRRGVAGFTRHRLMRVALPLVVGWLVLYPCAMALWTTGANVSGRNLVPLPLSLLFERMVGDGLMWVSRVNGGLFTLFHLWFLYYLLLLYACALGIRWAVTRSDRLATGLRQRADAWLAKAADSPLALAALVLLTGPLLWPMRLWFGVDLPSWTLFPMPAVLAVYGVFFGLGWLLHRQTRLLLRLARHWRWQLPAGLVLSVALFAGYHAAERRGAIQMGTYPTLEASQVLDWPAFLERLQSAAARGPQRTADPASDDRRLVTEQVQEEQAAPQEPAAELRNLWSHFPPAVRGAVLRLTDEAPLDARVGVLQTLGTVLVQPGAFGPDPIPPGPRPPPAIAFAAYAANRAKLERLMDGALAGDLRQLPWFWPAKLAYALTYSLVTWLLLLGTLGFFQERWPGHSPAWRYLADSSYWIYLVHLPVVAALQIWVADWPWPGLVKFGLINLIAFPILSVSYHCLVRSTFIGQVLNGQRHPFVAWPFQPAVGSRSGVAFSLPAEGPGSGVGPSPSRPNPLRTRP